MCGRKCTIAHLHVHVVHIVATRIYGHFEVRSDRKGEHSTSGDVEFRLICATYEAVGCRRTRIHIGTGHGDHGRLVLGDTCGCHTCDDRSFVDVGHGDGDTLRGGKYTIGDLYFYVVHIVPTHVSRRFKVRSAGKGEHPSSSDAKLGLVRTA